MRILHCPHIPDDDVVRQYELVRGDDGRLYLYNAGVCPCCRMNGRWTSQAPSSPDEELSTITCLECGAIWEARITGP